MRLIDADALIEEIAKMDISEQSKIFSVNMLRTAPTAYNLDAVVGQIHEIEVSRGEYSEMVECNIDEHGCMPSCYDCILNHVEMIVRNGGKE